MGAAEKLVQWNPTDIKAELIKSIRPRWPVNAPNR